MRRLHTDTAYINQAGQAPGSKPRFRTRIYTPGVHWPKLLRRRRPNVHCRRISRSIADADDDDVDYASYHRHRTLSRYPAAGLVADRGGDWPGSLCHGKLVHGTLIGRLILFGFTWALFTHMLGGIRHMIQDTGRWMDHPQREYLAQMTFGGGIILTILVWIVAYTVR